MKKILSALLLVSLISCKEDKVDPANVIFIRIADGKTSIPADNASTVTVEALIDVNADKDKREITFSTTGGVFMPEATQEVKVTAKDTLYIDDKAYLGAKATLKSGFVVSPAVTVTADIVQYKAKVPLAFSESEPSRIDLTANILGVVTSFESEATLTIKASSDSGVPSKGESVVISVTRPGTDQKLQDVRFRDEKLTFNADGVASVVFSGASLKNNGTPFTGDVMITAKVAGKPLLADSLLMNVSPKPD